MTNTNWMGEIRMAMRASRGRSQENSTGHGSNALSSGRSATCRQPALVKNLIVEATSHSIAGLERPLRIQQDGYRAVVHKFDVHHGLKTPGLADDAALADFAHKILVQLIRNLRGSGFVERWPFPFANITVKGELRYGENLTTAICHGEIHLPLFIFKDAQADNFRGKVVGIRLRVGFRHAKQHQQSCFDSADYFFTDAHLGPAHTLDDGSHQSAVLQLEGLRANRHRCNCAVIYLCTCVRLTATPANG